VRHTKNSINGSRDMAVIPLSSLTFPSPIRRLCRVFAGIEVRSRVTDAGTIWVYHMAVSW